MTGWDMSVFSGELGQKKAPETGAFRANRRLSPLAQRQAAHGVKGGAKAQKPLRLGARAALTMDSGRLALTAMQPLISSP
jgi:hypothetical protein